MRPPETRQADPAPTTPPGRASVGVPGPAGSRYGWFVGVVGLLIVALITINTVATTPNGARGVAPGHRVPPFAVPLAVSSLNGYANVATHADDGPAGKVPACSVRGPRVLNVCQQYERGPLVLALFVNGGACPGVLDQLQRLAPGFPGLQVAAVAIRGHRGALRALVRRRGWTFPVGYDEDGVLANLYKVSSCPQVSFVYPGGIVAEPALLTQPTIATLRSRLASLVAGARARGWRPS